MEQIPLDSISFVEKTLTLRMTPCIGYKPLFFKKYALPNSSYGEWLFHQKGIPSFYYSAFNQDGSANEIAQYIQENSLDLESTIISLLERKGFGNMKSNYNDLIQLEKRSKLIEMKLLEIIYKEN